MTSSVGISGFALYTPPFQVSLERWCDWTGNPWDKVSAVVGRSFRQPGEHESIYTMAANAALRLMEQYDIDPQNVGMLAFGTESSTDNAAGAVILRGMLDRALIAQGKAPLSRACEVPEFKHACLGGVYALKAAARFLATDGQGKQAIVVCGDIAEYERGSSGEQTQGAGAVAMLVEQDPQLLELHLQRAGSSSAYRGVDFRKPFSRHFAKGYAEGTRRLHDFPVFNGKYSTFCYQDAVAQAADAMLERSGEDPAAYYDDVAAIFMHRPYHWMPVSGLATVYTWGLARTESGRKTLEGLCKEAGVSYEETLAEIQGKPCLFSKVDGADLGTDPYPNANRVAKQARRSAAFKSIQRSKLRLGAEKMMDLGNLYTAALPAWMAAGLEHALDNGEELAGREILTIGYGSGDAAEAIPMTVVANWKDAAAKIGFDRALEGAIELSEAQYNGRHDGDPVAVPHAPSGEFIVERVGDQVAGSVLDVGIEYYRYIPAA